MQFKVDPGVFVLVKWNNVEGHEAMKLGQWNQPLS